MRKVYDIETFPNFFSYTDVDCDSSEVNVFVISTFKNQTAEFLLYLDCLEQNKAGMIGFNNIHFDWPVVNYIREIGNKITPDRIYDFVMTIIKSEKNIYTKQTIKQLDLFLLNHYDNKARSASLKSLEVSLNWENVMDMPIAVGSMISEAQETMVLEYNLNDVLFTRKFYEECADKIELRKKIGNKYKLDLINKSDVVIGETIFLKYLSQAMNMPVSELKKIRGKRAKVPLKDIIFDYVKFTEPKFQKLLATMCETTSSSEYLEEWVSNFKINKPVNELYEQVASHNIELKKLAQKKKSFGFFVNYAGLRIDYGVGGIHGCIKPGVYKSNDKYKILDIDVKSYYPNLFIQNNLHPRQMDQNTFISVYKFIFDERVKAQKEKDDITSSALKLALNGLFGKTGSDVSCFYDPFVFFAITVNGQLLITMLLEKLIQAGAELLQVNTDGVTIMIPSDQEYTFKNICAEWESVTKLQLEYADYASMVIRDVNNYIAVSTNGKVKEKGIFETKKDWHKDNSFMVVPTAVRNYFVDGIPITQTLDNHKNIYDFCGRYKATKGWHAEWVYLENDQEKRKGFGKIYRFIPVKKGGVSLKINQDGREHQLLDGYQTKPFNQIINIKKKDLDFSYYVAECEKLISMISPSQMTLL